MPSLKAKKWLESKQDMADRDRFAETIDGQFSDMGSIDPYYDPEVRSAVSRAAFSWGEPRVQSENEYYTLVQNRYHLGQKAARNLFAILNSGHRPNAD